MDQGLGERLFNFAVEAIKLLRSLQKLPEMQVIRYQLAKSSTSSGANYEEAQAASSRADFANKMKISLREMRESNYWLRICKKSDFGDLVLCENLLKESLELKNILGSICSKL
ncbi:MAG: four helix bundle protein [Ignavibacteriota bacterium]